MSDNALLVICGLAGVLFHCLIKLQGLLTDARVANIKFNAWKDYWVFDAVSIFLSILSVGIWLLIYKEVQGKYEDITNWTRVSFVAMGLVGSYGIQKLASRAKKRINEITDDKTNKHDGGSENVTSMEKPKTP